MGDYEIGFGKPPKFGQFKKGYSGNPKGRPKGSRNLATIVYEEFHRSVRLQNGDGHQLVEIGEAALMQQGNKAAMGDLKLLNSYLTFIKQLEPRL